MQKQAKITAEKQGVDNLQQLREKFADLTTAKGIEQQERTVTLVYKSCCGCGCRDMKISRSVSYDSPLKDGDRVKELLPNDKAV